MINVGPHQARLSAPIRINFCLLYTVDLLLSGSRSQTLVFLRALGLLSSNSRHLKIELFYKKQRTEPFQHSRINSICQIAKFERVSDVSVKKHL